MSRVAIIQPNYLPWKGYFDIIHRVDTFVLFDDVQYTTRDWRNRNRIKLPNGQLKWLSVPVLGGRDQLIREARIDLEQDWAESHVGLIRHAYKEAPHFDRYSGELEATLRAGYELLVDLDEALVRLVCGWVGIETRMVGSTPLEAEGTKDDRLLDLLRKLDATEYVSGPAARAYIDPGKFEASGIALVFYEYPEYPAYDQPGGPFEHGVSAIDLVFRTGPSAPRYIWG